MDVIDIIAFTFTLIRFIVIIPIMSYGLYQFYKHRNKQLISHRNPLLIYIIVIWTILTLAIERTFLICAFVFKIIDVEMWVVLLLLSVFWWALFGSFGVKVYNLYYQQQYNLSIADEVWKRDINPQTVDWYIKNKHKWGSAIWVAKLCSIPYIASCVIESLFPQFFGQGQPLDIFHSMIVFTPITVAFIVVYKARKLSDVWKMRDESLYQSLLVLLVVGVYTVTFCVGFHPYLIEKYGQDFDRFKWTLYVFYSDLIAILFAIFPTFYPLYLIKKAPIHPNQSFFIKEYIYRDDINVSVCSMNLIMAKYHPFQMFMNHLVSEFTAENGLFLVELIQIKHDHQKRNDFRVKVPKPKTIEEIFLIDFNVNHIDGKPYSSDEDRYFTYLFHEISGGIRCKLSIPIGIPRSSVLTNNENDLYKQMSCLYEKYVAVERLNISYKVHQDLDEIFASQSTPKNEGILFNVMDECATEILMLLLQSFSRFISKDSFGPILQEIKSEMGDTIDKVRIRSDIKMKELLNSGSIVSTKQMVHYYN